MKFETVYIDQNNKEFLREMIYTAIYVPKEAPPLPFSIIDHPDISKYIADWGKAGDFGVIAKTNEEKAGAIWIRYFDKNNPGYGFISEEIPELTMALKSEFRNRRLGTHMMQKFLSMCRDKEIQSISISVDKRNPAFSFYKRLGFKIVSENDADFLMKIDL
ncbi:MAG: GNAT family N-acetyltransferase [Fidelibacterota bacterium]